MMIFKRILPASTNAAYQGHVAAIWLCLPLLVFRLAVALLHILRADGGAQSVSTIPLNDYPPDAAANIIALYSRLGAEQLILPLLGSLVLIRYRSLLPVIYLAMLVSFALGKVTATLKPTITVTGSGASMPAAAIFALTLAGFVLSLRKTH